MAKGLRAASKQQKKTKARAGGLKPLSKKQQSLTLAERKLNGELQSFFDEYGCRPADSSSLGSRVKSLVIKKPVAGGLDDTRKKMAETPLLQTRMQKQVDAFLKDWRSGSTKKLLKWGSWAATYRFRSSPRAPSAFASALASMKGAGQSRKVTLKNAAAAVGASEEVERSSPVPIVNKSTTSGMTVPMTPACVVQWLYQAVVDIMGAFTAVFGEAKFDQHGRPTGSGLSDLTLFWGSHLGAVRDQAMIAWDYDADLALFLSSAVGDANFLRLWKVVAGKLQLLGYRCTMHGNLKHLRVSPLDPLAWSPYRELYHETYSKCKGKDRPFLLKTTARRWRQGLRASAPLGSNCVDIDIYKISPGSKRPLHITDGKTSFSLAVDKLLPTAVGVFGPLMLPLPRSNAPLFEMYGANCLTSRKVKVQVGMGTKMQDLKDNSIRRYAWPSQPLSRLGIIDLA